MRICKACEVPKALEKLAWNGKYYLYTCKPCQDDKDRTRMAKNYAKKKNLIQVKELHVGLVYN